MADSGRLDELKRKFDENPRRYFAPLANEYRKSGDTDRAIELCRTYLPQQPSHMSGYIVYGQALFDAGRAGEAADVFRQALTLDPENIIALRHLGDIARAAGDNAGAMQWYGKVLELDPKNEEIAAQITALAAPGSRPIPRNERAAPPTVRPEPEYDPAAVALSDLVARPDMPQAPVAQSSESTSASGPSRPEAAPAPDPAGAPTQAPAEVVLVEESFQVISWPAEAQAGSDQSVTEGSSASGPFDDAAGGVWDIDLEPGDGARSDTDAHPGQASPRLADFLPEEPTPLAPELDEPSGAGVGSGTGGSAMPPVPDSPFVTETMAELYVQQGHVGDAVVIYRQLLSRRYDPRLEQRLSDLERGNAAAEAEPVARAEGESEAGSETGSETGLEPASETVSEAGSEAGSETGSEADAERTPEAGERAAESAPPALSAQIAETVAEVLVGAVSSLVTGVVVGTGVEADSSASPPAQRSSRSGGETVREFFARIGSARPVARPVLVAEAEERGGLAAMFASNPGDEGDLHAAASLASAFDDPAGSGGRR